MKTKSAPRDLPQRSNWINAARNALIKHGESGVKVDILARQMKIARSSFYWRFENRQALLEALLADWRDGNTKPMLEAIKRARANGDPKDFKHVDELWFEEKDYDPRYDAAVREWARTDKTVAKAVRKIDKVRIDAFAEMFRSYGFKGKDALIRARILYYHQIGYYTLNIQETTEARRRLSPYYDKVLLY